MSVRTNTLELASATGINRTLWATLRRAVGLGFAIVLAFAVLGSSAVDALTARWRALETEVTGWTWNLLAWEAQALLDKANAQLANPAAQLTATQRDQLVQDYLDRAQKVGELEDRIDEIYSATAGAATAESRQLAAELEELRGRQETDNRAVEQIIQEQVSAELGGAGLAPLGATLPPVLFTFHEPPKKLVVSPRSRIDTVYYAMLRSDLPAARREEIEDDILRRDSFSAYVTNIGGLGAYPTIVIDQAPLDWILSTVAHEWVHNYLTFFPLGFNYATSAENTILNETVADIVGEEIGAAVLQAHYPDVAARVQAEEEERRVAESAATGAAPTAEPPFDFRKEMRHTRQIVDQFLALGRVKDAEEYMEIRRLLFNENGYPIRKLNQAYFAFHGSYGTGAAATSPIGPKLERLRALTPDLRTFLVVTRGLVSERDLDRVLAEWETRQ
jgi:hypothetical protein